ncbi:Spore coat protein F [Bacillus timonensis]|uniref:Spore coat protein F n=1 Tax=Bacillus timonensis TaxID=1033734 RepID=UPI000288D100|nr:Spore coat protein F [Bacillus timonensis]
MTKYMALHETLEVHEILTFKNLCLTKTVTMSGLVQDPELKAILSNDVSTSTKSITRLKELITDRSHKHE